MRLLIDNWSWQQYMEGLDQIGVGGYPYPFVHMNEPEIYPCMVDTMIDDEHPGTVRLVHVFFYPEDAAELLGVTERMTVKEESDEEVPSSGA